MALNAPGNVTPFPASPSAVAVLDVAEFTSELDVNACMEIEAVCQHFLGDANRALVCLIRFRALSVWRERIDIAPWLQSDPSHAQHACELAASFALNDDWEFDASRFRSAVARSA
jgi:hypothetical protein